MPYGDFNGGFDFAARTASTRLIAGLKQALFTTYYIRPRYAAQLIGVELRNPRRKLVDTGGQTEALLRHLPFNTMLALQAHHVVELNNIQTEGAA